MVSGTIHAPHTPQDGQVPRGHCLHLPLVLGCLPRRHVFYLTARSLRPLPGWLGGESLNTLKLGICTLKMHVL